jgi:Na+-driven multidrug efflux pump
MATGLQRYSIPSAVVEGVSNLGASVWMAEKMGAVGVAWGTVVGSIIGVIVLIGFVMRPRKDLSVHQGKFLWQGVATPLLVFSPFLAWIVFHR